MYVKFNVAHFILNTKGDNVEKNYALKFILKINEVNMGDRSPL